jgi:hypothetical protein
MSVRAVALDTLVSRADRIFIGRCIAVRELHDEQVGWLVTEATFAVSESIKPAPGPTSGMAPGARAGLGKRQERSAGKRITVRQLGGRRTPTLGPRFMPGEEVLLFLHRESRLGLASPVGMGQGKFTIVRRPHGQGPDLAVSAARRIVASPVLPGLRVLPNRGLGGANPPGIAPAQKPRGAESGMGVELEPLLRRIRGIVARGD